MAGVAFTFGWVCMQLRFVRDQHGFAVVGSGLGGARFAERRRCVRLGMLGSYSLSKRAGLFILANALRKESWVFALNHICTAMVDMVSFVCAFVTFVLSVCRARCPSSSSRADGMDKRW